MRPSLLLLLLLLLFLSLGSSSTFVECGSAGVSGFAAFGCSSEGATVFIDTGPPDSINTRVTDSAGQVFWNDTAFLTGFSADCGGQDIGTVEPYNPNTSFSYNLLVSASGLTPSTTVLIVNRESRDLALNIKLLPL